MRNIGRFFVLLFTFGMAFSSVLPAQILENQQKDNLKQDEKKSSIAKDELREKLPLGTGKKVDYSASETEAIMRDANRYLAWNFVVQMQKNHIDMHYDEILKGIKMAQEGKEFDLSRKDLGPIMNRFGAITSQRRRDAARKIGEANLAKGQQFLAEFAKRPGAIELDEGVFFISESSATDSGVKPALNDFVKVHYEIKLESDRVVDSTYARKQPLNRPVRMFPKGLAVALQEMSPGEKALVAIRGDKGYGYKPPSGVEPNELLLCKVELLELKKTPVPPTKKPAPPEEADGSDKKAGGSPGDAAPSSNGLNAKAGK